MNEVKKLGNIRMEKRFALLGWGSLLWDENKEFDDWHGPWQSDGPTLKIEFSRISSSRRGALTLVIDQDNGNANSVSWTLSRRSELSDVIQDLKKREKTIYKYIGRFSFGGDEHSIDSSSLSAIRSWANERGLYGVVWTGLPSNFVKETGYSFSIHNALQHLQSLDDCARKKALEYIQKAPDSIQTPLRNAITYQLESRLK